MSGKDGLMIAQMKVRARILLPVGLPGWGIKPASVTGLPSPSAPSGRRPRRLRGETIPTDRPRPCDRSNAIWAALAERYPTGSAAAAAGSPVRCWYSLGRCRGWTDPSLPRRQRHPAASTSSPRRCSSSACAPTGSMMTRISPRSRPSVAWRSSPTTRPARSTPFARWVGACAATSASSNDMLARHRCSCCRCASSAAGSADSACASRQALASEECVIVFPAGDGRDLGTRGIRDRSLAREGSSVRPATGTPVLPVRVVARNSALFTARPRCSGGGYRIAGARDVRRRARRPISLIVGRPMPLDPHRRSPTFAAVACAACAGTRPRSPSPGRRAGIEEPATLRDGRRRDHANCWVGYGQ